MIPALQDAEAEVRKQAAWALGMIEDGRALEALADALSDDNAEVRQQVLWALARCADGHDGDIDALAEQMRRALGVERNHA